MNPFITTFRGKKVNPLDLYPSDIHIHDIAHHLATLNRFVGAIIRPVSIAQHSVYVSRLVDGTGWEREALFHDAPEAYLGDVSKWVKKSPEMAAYREAENRAWLVICEALKLRVSGSPNMNPIVEKADRLMVRFENLKLSSNADHMFQLESHRCPTPKEIEEVGPWTPWSWQDAERGFLDHARLLGFEV